MDISLVITTYQREHLLAQSLDRLLEMTPPAELIVVDDGGSDGTRDVVWRHAMQASHPVEYIYTHNPGKTICSHARNVGVKLARNEFIVTSEPELCFLTDVLAQFAELQSEHPEEVISTGRITFAPEGYVFDVNNMPEGHVETGWVAPHAALWRKSWLEEVGGWDEDFPGNWGWDDTDLLTRLRLSGHGQHIALGVEALHLWHPLGGDADSMNDRYFRSKTFNHDESDRTDLIANKERPWGVPKPRPATT